MATDKNCPQSGMTDNQIACLLFYPVLIHRRPKTVFSAGAKTEVDIIDLIVFYAKAKEGINVRQIGQIRLNGRSSGGPGRIRHGDLRCFLEPILLLALIGRSNRCFGMHDVISEGSERVICWVLD